MNNIIAIDGPSGVGKGSLMERLAEHFDYDTLDTGSIYRAVTLMMLDAGYAMDDTEHAVEFARSLGDHIQDLATDSRLRSPEVNANVSLIAKNPEVRTALFDFQVDFAHNYAARGKKGVILDGRDIGTVIAPDASVKIFITASAEERAKRRLLQNQELGIAADYEAILANIKERDLIDSTREVAATRAADDAFILDTSNIDLDEVFEIVLKYIDERRKTV